MFRTPWTYTCRLCHRRNTSLHRWAILKVQTVLHLLHGHVLMLLTMRCSWAEHTQMTMTVETLFNVNSHRAPSALWHLKNKCSLTSEMGDHLATTDMDEKLGGAGSPSNTMSPGPRPTSLPSGILIHPAVWPQ